MRPVCPSVAELASQTARCAGISASWAHMRTIVSITRSRPSNPSTAAGRISMSVRTIPGRKPNTPMPLWRYSLARDSVNERIQALLAA